MPNHTLIGTLIAAVGSIAAAQQAPATTPQADPPTFEVASIRLNPAINPPIGNHFDPARATWTAVPLKMLILNAYGMRPYQLIGGPSWLDSDRWDIDARTGAPTTTMQKFQMLQPLLADRFQLRFHREARELPRYTLVVAKGGPKFQPTKEGDTGQAGLRTGNGILIGHKYPIADPAGWLSMSVGAPVDDKTGLTRPYDFELRWNQNYGQAADVVPAPGDDGISMFTGIQDQMGLKLEPGKAATEVIVIDHVEKPSQN